MKLLFRGVRGNGFRSVAILLCIALATSYVLFTTLVSRGAQHSLNLNADRFGADIVVVPGEDQAGKAGDLSPASLARRFSLAKGRGGPAGPLGLGASAAGWMPEETLRRVASVPGVVALSPQLYLATVAGSPLSPSAGLIVVAFDPQSDFTVQVWLPKPLGRPLGPDEALAGSDVVVPAAQGPASILSREVTVVGRLEPSGTMLDRALFVSFATADQMIDSQAADQTGGPAAPPRSVSTIMVKVAPGADVDIVAVDILRAAPEALPVQAARLFSTFRLQMAALQTSFLAMLIAIWPLALLAVALLFSLTTSARRQELGVWRALGSSRGFALRSLLAELAALATAGGALGIIAAGLFVFLAGGPVVDALGLPFVFPPWPEVLAFAGLGFGLALASALLAGLVPALLASRRDPGEAMRE